MKDRKGSALVTVLLTVTVLSILGVAIVTVMWQRMHMAANYQYSNQAYYAANAGLEQMKQYVTDKIADSSSDITTYMQSYITSNPGKTNAEYTTAANTYKVSYFNTNVNGRTINNASAPYTNNTEYTASAAYNSGADTVTITSTGIYNKGPNQTQKTITATISISSTSQAVTGGGGGGGSDTFPAYDLATQFRSSWQATYGEYFSLYGQVKNLTIQGDLYLPNKIENMAANTHMIFDNLTVGSTFRVSNSANALIEVNGDLKVNGDLILLDQTNMKLKVTGNLTVTGNISLQAQDNKIEVGGNVYCGGIVVFADAPGFSFTITNNLYLTNITNITKPRAESVLTYASLGTVAAVSVPSAAVSLGTDQNVFNISTPNLVKLAGGATITSNNGTYGTEGNPKVIYCTGDLTIQNPNASSTIDIYGIVYATGKIAINNFNGISGGTVNIYGALVCGTYLDIFDNAKTVNILKPNATTKNALAADTGLVNGNILKYFNPSTSTTANIPIPSSNTLSAWSE